MNKKYTARVATAQYEFIEIEGEDMDSVVDDYLSIKAQFNEEDKGLDIQKWAKFRDTYLATGEIDLEQWELLSKAQRYWVNETKKGFKNIKGDSIEYPQD